MTSHDQRGINVRSMLERVWQIRILPDGRLVRVHTHRITIRLRRWGVVDSNMVVEHDSRRKPLVLRD